MRQLNQSKFNKNSTEYQNVASPSGSVKALRVDGGKLQYTTDYTNYDNAGGSSTLTGASDPTTATVGEVGQFYLNTTTNNIFMCVANGGGSYTWQASAGNSKEDKSNKVTSISNTSTDTEYPSAKCVYDIVGDLDTILQTLNNGGGV